MKNKTLREYGYNEILHTVYLQMFIDRGGAGSNPIGSCSGRIRHKLSPGTNITQPGSPDKEPPASSLKDW